ncbi:MAG TPA: TonB-dependent receptor [Vicinamibacterales bacterium]|nr:TonB-dependent receptor [Vicinamibacterales bacterium]
MTVAALHMKDARHRSPAAGPGEAPPAGRRCGRRASRRRTWHPRLAACLLLALAPPAAAGDLDGRVTDATGAVVSGARVVVYTPQRAVVATVETDAAGRFVVTDLAEGTYLVAVERPPFAPRREAVVVPPSGAVALRLVLDLAAVGEEVTVTARPGEVAEAARLTQPVNLVDSGEILIRAKTVVAQAVEGEAGAHLQRTSPGMAGIFVRGLTGNKVNVFVDGVRYSNGAQRGGVNTFLDLIDPSVLEGLEILRGPSSAQYGSDALGGSVQFLTRAPLLAASGRPSVSGSIVLGAETAHPGGTAALTAGYARARLGLLGSASARRTGDYRPGGGIDSHAAVTRFFGIPSTVLYPDRMPGTGFRQSAAQLRANWLAGSDRLLVLNYVRARQDDAERWDQTLGGDGNLIADLNDLQLDLFYARLETLAAGWFDRASVTYSFNTQREERVNQGGNGDPAAPIVHEPERTTVHGVQVNASRRLADRHTVVAGGDVYFESIAAPAFAVDPLTGARTLRRPRIPDGAVYRQGGAFLQAEVEAIPERLALSLAGRAGFASYRAEAARAPVVGGRPLWPDDALDAASATFRAGLAYTPRSAWTLVFAVSRGYRAPHMTDLGTLGLTGSGFEVAAPDLAGRAAFVGSTADASAVSTGRPVRQVEPESSLAWDLGVHYRSPRARLFAGAFVNDIAGNIQKQALILPPGAVGTTIAGEPVIAQAPGGAVFVARSTVPVLVRANFDDARIWGVELDGEAKLGGPLSAGGTFTYLRARDRATQLPPNIEGGTPAPGGLLWLRYARPTWWIQPYVLAAADQPHLSSLDLGDRRIGAARSRASIERFFRNGARARGWIAPGPDGAFGTADDRLIATGETLAEIQHRVLGPGVSSAPLFTAIPGYVVFGVRVGVRAGAHEVVVDAENLGDENYRGVSWGMDAPGRGVSVRYAYRF